MSVPWERLILRCTRSSIYQEVNPEMNPDGYRLTVIHSRLYYFALSVCVLVCVCVYRFRLPSPPLTRLDLTLQWPMMYREGSRWLNYKGGLRLRDEGKDEKTGEAQNYREDGVHLANIGSTLSALQKCSYRHFLPSNLLNPLKCFMSETGFKVMQQSYAEPWLIYSEGIISDVVVFERLCGLWVKKLSFMESDWLVSK